MDLSLLMEPVESKQLKRIIFHREFDDSREILLADADAVPTPGNVYITEPCFIDRLLEKAEQGADLTFFVAGDCTVSETRCAEKRINLVAADMTLTELHNCLCSQLHKIRSFRQQCMNDIWKNTLPYSVVSSGAAQLHTPVFLLNQRLELIYHDSRFAVSDNILTQENGADVFVTDPILNLSSAELSSTPSRFYTRNGNIFWIKQLKNESVLFYLAALVSPERKDESFEAILDIVGDYILMQSSHVARTTPDPSCALSNLLDAFAENRVLASEELRMRLKRLEYPVERFFTIIIVFPAENNSGFSPASAMKQLRRFFPGQNICIRNDMVVILFCHKDHFTADYMDETQFDAILAGMNCYAAINNPISNWAKLNTSYKLSQMIMHIALTTNKNEAEHGRIFKLEDYGTYLMFHLCQQAFKDFGFSDEELIYLGNPALASLAIHDSQNGDNLVEVLYQYLSNDKNAIRTGEALYMHRNTVRKRLQQIKEITKIDIDDSALYLRLLLSCSLIHYYRDYLGRPFQATVDADGPNDIDSLWPSFTVHV